MVIIRNRTLSEKSIQGIGLHSPGLFLLTLVCGTIQTFNSVVLAEKYAIVTEQETYQLYEPVILDVTVQQDVPSDQSLNQQRRPRTKRSLELILRNGGAEVLIMPLGSVDFPSLASTPVSTVTIYTSIGLVRTQLNESTFSFWDQPGWFSVLLRDADSGVLSNEVRIQYREPPAEERVAAEIFKSTGSHGLRSLVVGDCSGQVEASFSELAHAHALTIYGKYARAALARSEANRVRTMDEPGRRELSLRIERLTEEFEIGHPMRSHCLLLQARIQRLMGNHQESADRARQLLRESRDENMKAMAAEILKVMPE